MTDSPASSDTPASDESIVPIEHEDVAEQPRRQASALLQAESAIGSEAAMRRAMDPANQSLADALRLSFRVLQIVMVVLVGLFLVSGMRNVKEGQVGIKVVAGRIVEQDGYAELGAGLKLNWPYPIGDFVLVDTDNRSVQVRDAFWPNVDPAQTIEQVTNTMQQRSTLDPRREGYILTQDADIAHLRANADYKIDDAVTFITRVNDASDEFLSADQLVRLAARRSVVHVAARSSLQAMTEDTVIASEEVTNVADDMMQRLECGMTIENIDLTDATPAFKIRAALQTAQEARQNGERVITNARQQANDKLTRIARNHEEILELINDYERALEFDDGAKSDEAFEAIKTAMRSDDTGGTVSETMNRADSFRNQIQFRYKSLASRFSSAYPRFQESPHTFVAQQLASTRANVMNGKDTEVVFLPLGTGHVNLRLFGNAQISLIREQMRIQEREAEGLKEMYGQGPWMTRPDEYDATGSRQLRIENGRTTGK